MARISKRCESWGGRCREIWLDQYSARRCRFNYGHPGDCIKGPYGDGICMRRSTNMTTRLTRFCALTADHDDWCVYLTLTERQATPAELRFPERFDKPRHIVITE